MVSSFMQNIKKSNETILTNIQKVDYWTKIQQNGSIRQNENFPKIGI